MLSKTAEEVSMQRPLANHIMSLEQKIGALNLRLNEGGLTPLETNEVRIDLGIAERALVHFRKAFELEQRLEKRVEELKGI
jgi:hypothetical protein